LLARFRIITLNNMTVRNVARTVLESMVEVQFRLIPLFKRGLVGFFDVNNVLNLGTCKDRG
uniref:hypothetical protein n=1 Tax=Algoriphagus antarcticus TaxID=238540 RepID=UPI00196B398E